MSITIQVEAFLNKKKTAWSETTIKTCGAFLNKHGQLVAKGDPQSLWNALSSKGRYTVQTYFVHAASFYEFLNPGAPNPFRAYREENLNAFKNAYKRKTVEVSYKEARKLIEAQPESDEKEACLYLLRTAQRSSEAGLARSERGGETSQEVRGAAATIVGKGGKERINLGADILPKGHVRWNYYRVYRYLKRLCGISPHDLRKLAITEAARRGASAADLCEIAGWSHIATAYYYLQPQQARRLKAFLG
jgi:integrase